jgi:hypothetical protein
MTELFMYTGQATVPATMTIVRNKDYIGAISSRFNDTDFYRGGKDTNSIINDTLVVAHDWVPHTIPATHTGVEYLASEAPTASIPFKLGYNKVVKYPGQIFQLQNTTASKIQVSIHTVIALNDLDNGEVVQLGPFDVKIR